MSFIAKNPLIIPEIDSPPSTPKLGTRGIFAGKDGWYEIDSGRNINKIATLKEIASKEDKSNKLTLADLNGDFGTLNVTDDQYLSALAAQIMHETLRQDIRDIEGDIQWLESLIGSSGGGSGSSGIPTLHSWDEVDAMFTPGIYFLDVDGLKTIIVSKDAKNGHVMQMCFGGEGFRCRYSLNGSGKWIKDDNFDDGWEHYAPYAEVWRVEADLYSQIEYMSNKVQQINASTATEYYFPSTQAVVNYVRNSSKYYEQAGVIPSDQDMFTFTKSGTTAKLTGVNTNISGEIVIPYECTINGTTYPVTAVGQGAFMNQTEITSVIIPNTVTSVQTGAFQGCYKLESVALPDSLTSLGGYAFQSCTVLKSIVIPEGVSILNSYTFDECVSLESITLPTTLTKIASYTVGFCPALFDIYYAGTKAQWDKIDIGGDDVLTDVSIRYGSIDTSGFLTVNNIRRLIDEDMIPTNPYEDGTVPNSYAVAAYVKGKTDGKKITSGYDAVTSAPDGERGFINDSTFPSMLYLNKCFEQFRTEIGNSGGGSSTPSVKKTSISLPSASWKLVEGSEVLYRQSVSIDGVTTNSMIDLQPTPAQLAIFYEKDVTFVTENDNGAVTVYCIGQKPMNDYTIQATVTEVER